MSLYSVIRIDAMPVCTNSLDCRPTVQCANTPVSYYADHQHVFSDQNPIAPPRRKKSSTSVTLPASSDMWATLPHSLASETRDKPVSSLMTPPVPPRRQNCHVRNGNDVICISASPQLGDHGEAESNGFDHELARTCWTSSSWSTEVEMNHGSDNESMLSLKEGPLTVNNSLQGEQNGHKMICIANNTSVNNQLQSTRDVQVDNKDTQNATASNIKTSSFKWRDKLFDECDAWNDYSFDHSLIETSRNSINFDRNTIFSTQNRIDKNRNEEAKLRHDREATLRQGQGQTDDTCQ